MMDSNDDEEDTKNDHLSVLRLDHMEGENVSTAQHKRLELKIRELESKLELEKTTKQRQDTQVARQKEVKYVLSGHNYKGQYKHRQT